MLKGISKLFQSIRRSSYHHIDSEYQKQRKQDFINKLNELKEKAIAEKARFYSRDSIEEQIMNAPGAGK